MSTPQVRRADRLMSDDQTLSFATSAFCGRLATVGADGYPYCVPLLFVWDDGEILVHNTAARGHLRSNVERDPRICFEIDEPGEIFDYGRFECDSSVAYTSVVVFGTIRIIAETARKHRFCDLLMAKYGKPTTERPKGFYPRLDQITVYAIAIERMTGKHNPLPAVAEQWPALDRTKSPQARP